MDTQLNTIGKRFDDFVYVGAIRILGGGARAYAALAERYLSRGWIEEAFETYRKAIEEKPNHADYHYRVAQLLARQDRFSEAASFCDEALRCDKDLAKGYVLLGSIQKKLGDSESAMASYRKAMTYTFNDAAAYNTMARAFAEAELYEEAVQAYQEIIRISPRNVTAYGVMADTYAKLKRYPEALEAYRHAVDLKPTADGYGILATAYARSGQFQQAVGAYQKAMKLEPGFAHGWNRLSEIYVRLEDFEKRSHGAPMDEATKVLYAKLRQEQEAIERFKETIRQKPNDPEAYLEMGRMYIELKLPAKAIDFIRHVLRAKTPGVQSYRLLGQAHLALNHYKEARWAMEQALQLNKNDADTWTAMGELAVREGRHNDSVKAFQEALRLKPQEPDLHRQMGDLLRRLGRFADASRYYWQAIRLNPQDGLARFGLGVACVRLNQRERALEQKAILRTIDPKLVTELDHVIWQLTRTPKI
jgi:pentatricopeptide repeat protein